MQPNVCEVAVIAPVRFLMHFWDFSALFKHFIVLAKMNKAQNIPTVTHSDGLGD